MDVVTKDAWLEFDMDKRYASHNVMNSLQDKIEIIREENGRAHCKVKKAFKWNSFLGIEMRILELQDYHNHIRSSFHYIYGDTKLWYLKKDLSNKDVLDRNSVTLIYAVMHWLSELVRYSPQKFANLMESKQNWLIQEFIDNALYQFIDEISCEITKNDIMTTGHRK